MYLKNSNNCSPVISHKSYDLDNKFYVEKRNFNALKKMFFFGGRNTVRKQNRIHSSQSVQFNYVYEY